jgi:hypothetical protein
MKIQLNRQAIIGAIFLIANFAPLVVYADVPIKINAWGIHQGEKIVYRYQIVNNSYSIIYQASIGLNAPGKELPGKPWSLNPAYSDIPVQLSTEHCKPFYYMDCSIVVFQFDYMPEPKTKIMMRGVENSMTPPPKKSSGANFIWPGTQSSIAELYVPKEYQSTGYLTAYGQVYLLDNNTRNPDGTVITSVEMPFTKLDNALPTLSVKLTPDTLWSPNEKSVPITAAITTQDDYDPEPEIKLESITANEKLEAEDIRDAALGTDDRQFRLRAERRGEWDNRDGRERDDRREKDHRSDIDAATVPTGRIYTVTYSATDASGNKTTASATVTVPHDQRKNDRDEKDKGGDKDKWNR